MRPFPRFALLSLLIGAALAGCATPGARSGFDGGPRSITLHHPASGETVRVTYWTPAGYNADALHQIALLFRDRRSGEVIPIDPALVDMLVLLRERCGAPADAAVEVTSGYRSPASNAILAKTNANVADNSYHMRGQAADIDIPGVPPERLAEAAAELHLGGYALYPRTGHVHVDTGPYRTWTPKDGEPRTTPVSSYREARNGPRKPPLAPVRERPVAVAQAQTVPVEPLPVKRAAESRNAESRNAESRNAESRNAGRGRDLDTDMARIRYVLAQIKDQPASGK